jgi:hypothetical protein
VALQRYFGERVMPGLQAQFQPTLNFDEDDRCVEPAGATLGLTIADRLSAAYSGRSSRIHAS